MSEVVIVGAARTAIGSFGGALSSLSAAELGKVAIEEALKRSQVAGKGVDLWRFPNQREGGRDLVGRRMKSRGEARD